MTTKACAAVFTFFILFLFSSCEKEISYSNDTGVIIPGSSVFTFAGSPAACSSPVINGSFQAGTVLNNTNSIIVQVNVTTIGTYNIGSNSANGLTFTGTGTFTATGLQTITLQASGTPVASGTFDFNLGAGGCTFTVTCIAGTTPPTPPPGSGCKECEYLPVCIQSKYTYSDTISGAVSTRNIEYLSSVDTTVGGKIYKKLNTTTGVTYINCTNGASTVLAYQVVSANGNTLQKFQSVMIKANAAIGDDWADTLQNPAGQTVIQNFKIVNKGVTRKLGSFTFNDVIIVGVETGIDFPGFGYFPAGYSEYYYAKGVGLIETITKDFTTGTVIMHSVVKSYYIP
jgi:hypothetical protein